MMSQRRIVIHHTHILQQKILELLQTDDVVYFDDCLFSQYVFLREKTQFFIKKNITVIIGFSSGLYASESCNKQTYDVTSNALHHICNKCIKTINDANSFRDSLPEMNGFMKISQLKELLEFPFVKLALHGCCHLKLEDEYNLIAKAMMFKKDLNDAIAQLEKLKLKTNIYIYPYVYSFLTSDMILKKSGFNEIVGSKTFRISIEDLNAFGKNALCNS